MPLSTACPSFQPLSAMFFSMFLPRVPFSLCRPLLTQRSVSLILFLPYCSLPAYFHLLILLIRVSAQTFLVFLTLKYIWQGDSDFLIFQKKRSNVARAVLVNIILIRMNDLASLHGVNEESKKPSGMGSHRGHSAFILILSSGSRLSEGQVLMVCGEWFYNFAFLWS